QRQNRLARAIAPLLRRPAGRIALDDEQLAAFARRVGTLAQLAGKVQARRGRALARHLRLRRAARLARPRREDDAGDDRFGDADVVIQPVLEGRPDDAVNRGDELGVVQPILGLPLELRLLDEDAQHPGQPFADVLGRDRDALRRQVVRLDEVANRLAETAAQAALVRAAGTGRDAVHVRAQMFFGRLGPLYDEIDPHAVVFRQYERRVVHRFRTPRRDDRLQGVDDPFGMFEYGPGVGRLVFERHLEPFVEVARYLEALADDHGVEFDLREDGGVGVEEDRRAGAARGAKLLQRRRRLALLEAHLPLPPVTLDG